jgi:hypothetical protein
MASTGQVCLFKQSDLPITISVASDVASFGRVRSRPIGPLWRPAETGPLPPWDPRRQTETDITPLCRDPAVPGTGQNPYQPITLNALSA